MDNLLETIDLDVDESSELLFKVRVEGIEPSPTKIRLVCEVDDFAYMFNGHAISDDGTIQFNLPALKGKVKEGTYPSRVEVLVENRYFAPVQFNLRFKKVVSVVAEAVQVVRHRAAPEVKVTASPIVNRKPVDEVVKVPASTKKVVAQVKPEPGVKTLRERYESRQEIDELDEGSKNLIRELTQKIVNGKRF